MSRVGVAGLGLALLLVIAGEGAAQAQRSQPVQSVPESQAAPRPAPAETPAAEPATPTRPSGAPALIDQRGSQQAPIAIRVVPTPKSEDELIAERQEREQRASLETTLTLVAWLLVGIGFLQFLAVAAQGLFLTVALNAVRRPVEVAERNLALAQRAFVFVGSVDWSVAGANLRVAPNLENGGTTPSRSLRISTNWRAWHGELPPDFVYNYSQAPHRLFLGARSRVQIGSVLIPMRDIQAAIEGRLHLYLWGRATYEDMFEGSEPHFVEFCFRLEPAGSTSETMSLAFLPYGPHNRTEHDSQRNAEPAKR